MSQQTAQGSSAGSGVVNEAVESLANSLLNGTNSTNGTAEADKFKASPQGLLIAYTSLVILALIPIVVGSFKSVKHQKKQQVCSRIQFNSASTFKLEQSRDLDPYCSLFLNKKESGEEIETMSTKEAMMFPVIASVTLFGIYLVFQVSARRPSLLPLFLPGFVFQVAVWYLDLLQRVH